MSITAAQVKELREISGAGMMDCKTALMETNGDMEAAVDWLRAKGISKADKKAGRTAAEGLVGVATNGKKSVVVEVNSETDFVARNDAFQDIVRNVANIALNTDGSTAAVAAATYPSSGKSVVDTIKDAVGTIGENLSFRRSAALSVNEGLWLPISTMAYRMVSASSVFWSRLKPLVMPRLQMHSAVRLRCTLLRPTRLR